jgi:hypothetical protein
MSRIIGILSLAAVLAASCRSNFASRKPWSFAEHIGIAAQRSGKECLEIRNSFLAPDSPVRLVNTAEPQTIEKARIVSRDESCRDPNAPDPELQPYAIGLDQTSAHGFAPVIAIVNYGAGWEEGGEKHGGPVAADLDGDGKLEHFRSCASAEGIHLTVWTGQPITGILRWHQYHYLGYDVTPDCKNEEVDLRSGQ